MDVIDKKFERFKDAIYKLGLKPNQFREMVMSQSLFEWSSETAIALSMRFCSWVVQEDAHGEDEQSEANDEMVGEAGSQQSKGSWRRGRL